MTLKIIFVFCDCLVMYLSSKQKQKIILGNFYIDLVSVAEPLIGSAQGHVPAIVFFFFFFFFKKKKNYFLGVLPMQELRPIDFVAPSK
jgi:hypothetical protein